MVIPSAKSNHQHVRRMLPYGRSHINQRCCYCRKRTIKLWRKVVSLYHLGHVVVRHLCFLCLLLGWRSCHVRRYIYSFAVVKKLSSPTFIRITYQKHSLDTMTAIWLLPVVTLLVASSSGGVLCKAIQVYSQLHALQTLTVSVFMVTVGLSLALMILTIYFMRLILHGLPPGTSTLSVFLPLGPTGQSGYAILLIGQNINQLLPYPSQSIFLNSSTAGQAVETISICVSFLLWSLATMWILYALLAVYSRLRQSRVEFIITFWGLVFPNVTTNLFFLINKCVYLLTHTHTQLLSFRASTQILQSNLVIHLIPRRFRCSVPFMRYAHCWFG